MLSHQDLKIASGTKCAKHLPTKYWLGVLYNSYFVITRNFVFDSESIYDSDILKRLRSLTSNHLPLTALGSCPHQSLPIFHMRMLSNFVTERRPFYSYELVCVGAALNPTKQIFWFYKNEPFISSVSNSLVQIYGILSMIYVYIWAASRQNHLRREFWSWSMLFETNNFTSRETDSEQHGCWSEFPSK
jgi:hypothetical protein